MSLVLEKEGVKLAYPRAHVGGNGGYYNSAHCPSGFSAVSCKYVNIEKRRWQETVVLLDTVLSLLRQIF